MATTQIGEAHQVIMGIGHEQGFDKVFVFGGCCLLTATATFLRLVVIDVLGFDVAAVG